MNGQFVLVSTTLNEQQTTISREVIKASVAEFEDVAMVKRTDHVRRSHS